MKERIENKLKELQESYNYWLEVYDKEGLEYQEHRLNIIKEKIMLLEEILEDE